MSRAILSPSNETESRNSELTLKPPPKPLSGPQAHPKSMAALKVADQTRGKCAEHKKYLKTLTPQQACHEAIRTILEPTIDQQPLGAIRIWGLITAIPLIGPTKCRTLMHAAGIIGSPKLREVTPKGRLRLARQLKQKALDFNP